MDEYDRLEQERETLEALVEDRMRKGLPINDEILLSQNEKVDELLNAIMRKEAFHE